MRRALRKNIRALLPVLALAAIGLGVAGYILSNQRLRFPVVEEKPVEIKMELATAQAVVPGQGQTVRVSGVQIGSIGEVKLVDGHALVTLEIEPRYDDVIRADATALLRPKTGLKDMFVEVDPGSDSAPAVREGETIRLANTAPDVNPDEVLATLDADTRAYLRLLVTGAGRGLRGRGTDLREVFRRFEPTHRDLARVNGAVATRRANLRRLVHSLRLLSTELAGKEDDLARLVDKAADVFRAYASEDANISRAVSRLPGALRQATDTLGRVERFARVLGPASERLRPAVRALGESQQALRPFAKEARPIVEHRIRPFVRAARPLVRDLRPAAVNLAPATPNLTRSLTVINRFFNMASYNPNGREGPDKPGRDEGYLFYAGWIGHQTSNVFSTADAHGPLRPSLVSMSCQTARALAGDEGQLDPDEFLLNLTPLIANPELCGDR